MLLNSRLKCNAILKFHLFFKKTFLNVIIKCVLKIKTNSNSKNVLQLYNLRNTLLICRKIFMIENLFIVQNQTKKKKQLKIEEKILILDKNSMHFTYF